MEQNQEHTGENPLAGLAVQLLHGCLVVLPFVGELFCSCFASTCKSLLALLKTPRHSIALFISLCPKGKIEVILLVDLVLVLHALSVAGANAKS